MASGNKARILFVSTQYGFFGGIEHYIYDAALALRNGGFCVDGMFADKAHEHEKFAQAFGKIYEPSELAQLRGGEYDLAFIHKVEDPQLIRDLRTKFKTAVMFHDHDYYCLRRYKRYPFIRRNCKRAFQPFFCGVCAAMIDRGAGMARCANLRKRVNLLNEARNCNAHVISSTFMRSELLFNNFDVAKIIKIYQVCKVAPRREKSRSGDAIPNLIFVGQLIRHRGVQELLEALSMVRYQFKAYIIGSGPEEKRLHRLTNHLNLADEVVFTGWVKNLPEYYEKSDIAVFPQLWQEPFGIAGVQANAWSLPVVGFDSGGVSEWLRHERNGLIVRPKDIRGFANALDLLISDPGYAGRLGDEGRQWVAHHLSEENYVSGFKLMLDRVHSK